MIAMTCQNTTIADLSKNLPNWAGGYIDHPVVDSTGLQGGWDFVLSWTPRGALETPTRTPESAGGTPSAPDPGGVSLFTAVEKLGLKLVIQQHAVPAMVIDHVEQLPK